MGPMKKKLVLVKKKSPLMKKKSALMKENLLNFLTAINNPKTSVY